MCLEISVFSVSVILNMGLELGHKGTIPKCQHSHDSFVLKDALGGTFTLIPPVILSPLILKLMKTLTKHDEEKS